MLLLDLVGLERCQTAEGQLQDRLRLDHGQARSARPGRCERPRDRETPRIRAMTSSRFVHRDQVALEYVRALLGAAQLVLRAANDDLALVIDVVPEHLAQRQRARDVVDQRDHVHAERRLQRRVLVELVEHDLRDRVALELDHDPHAATVGLVAQVADLRDLLLARRGP